MFIAQGLIVGTNSV